MDLFDKTFDAYKDMRGKFDSNFTIVIYNYPTANVIEKLEHHLGLINLISDRFKRGFLYNRLNEFKNYINNRYSDGNITGIFLVGNGTYYIDISNDWQNAIDQFDVNPFILKHSAYFDIDFLRTLLTDVTYYNVITVLTNRFTHDFYNKSKRKFIHQDVAKAVNLIGYLKDIKGTCLVHGTSGLLSNIQNSSQLEKHIIVTKLLHETEVGDVFEKRENDKNCVKLEYWLSKILHPELGKRLVFKRDIPLKIQNKQIETLFCSQELADKINKRVPPDLKNYKITIIKSYGDDIGKKLEKDYGGIIGITYY